MSIRVSKDFLNGMNFILKRSYESTDLNDVVYTDTINIAWNNTGKYLNKSIMKYEKEKRKNEENKKNKRKPRSIYR